MTQNKIDTRSGAPASIWDQLAERITADSEETHAAAHSKWQWHEPAWREAAIRPYESAVLPETWRYVPGRSFAGATSYETAKSSDVSP